MLHFYCANQVWINILKLRRGKVLVLTLNLVIILPACASKRAKIRCLKLALRKLQKARIMCAELRRAPLQQHSLLQTSFNSAIVLPSSIFCKCSLFIRRKKKDAMECISNAGIWEMFLCEMDRFPFFVPPTDGDALALLHGPPWLLNEFLLGCILCYSKFFTCYYSQLVLFPKKKKKNPFL